MNDHKTEALRISVLAHDNKDMGDYEIASHQMQRAQMHATLYLAEQHRVANLLAAAAFITQQETVAGVSYTGLGGWAQDSEANIHSLMADEDFWVSLMGEVRYATWQESWKS